MINNNSINMKAMEIKKLEIAKKELEEKIKKAKGGIKDIMKAEGVTEIKTDKFIIRNTSVTTNRFDTTKFKKEHIDLYEAYTVASISERFSIN